MIELLTGAGLAASAGLNAYIPLLLLGLASRLLDVVSLPSSWAWLENEWVLGTLCLLLVIELVADKIPAVDSVNDWIQTVVRPTSGGLAFGSGSMTETLAVEDPAAFFESNQWVPIAGGVVIALVVHLIKMSVRPILNAMTAGVAAPLMSTVEDLSSVLLSVLALLLPVLIVIVLPLLAWALVSMLQRARRRRAPSRA